MTMLSGDVWSFQTSAEDVAGEELARLIQHCIDNGDEPMRNYVRRFWDGEDWESIVKKFDTDGSTWYVWWMDGVRAMIAFDEEQGKEIVS